MVYTLPSWVNGQSQATAENLNLYTSAITDLDTRVTAQSTSLPQVPTIAALRGLSGAQLGGAVRVMGYYAVNDGGGGVFYYNSSSSVVDDAGLVIQPNSLPASGRWERQYDGEVFNVRWFGARGTGIGGAADDQAAFTAAFTAAGNTALIGIPAGSYYVTGGFTQGTYGGILGEGVDQTSITHTGNNAFVTATDSTDLFAQRRWIGFTLIGNTGGSAKGIVHGNATAARFEELRVTDYTGGTGIELTNTVWWTEETYFDHVHVRNCLKNIAFTWTAPGTNSFSSTRFGHVLSVVSAANGIGMYVAPGSNIYGATLNIKFHIEVTSGIGLYLDTAAWIINTLYSMLCELNANPAAGKGGVVTVGAAKITGRGSIVPFPSSDAVDGSNVPLHNISTTTLVSVADSPGQFIIGLNPASILYYPIVTLPVSGGGTLDKVVVEMFGGPDWSSAGIAHDTVIFANRASFGYQYQRTGIDTSGNRANMGVVAYNNGGAVSIWVKVAASSFVSAFFKAYGQGINLGIAGQPQSEAFAVGSPTSTVPSGTLVFDATSSTYKPNMLLEGGSITTNAHLIGGSAAPAIASGTGAGTTPTVSIAGTDLSGLITVTTGGTMTGTNATVVTVTFATAFATAPRVVISPASSQAAALTGATQVFVDSASVSTTVFLVKTGTTALTAGQTLRWYYQVIQ